jgi:hypothetical protein
MCFFDLNAKNNVERPNPSRQNLAKIMKESIKNLL